MRKRIGILLCICSIVAFVGCSDSDISRVKDGVLELDKSLTVGQAIGNYKYFKKAEWKALTTDNGRKIVEVDGDIDIEKHPSINAKEIPNLKQAYLRLQFTINQDDTFQIGWCGVGFEKQNGEKLEPKENADLVSCANSLQSIYQNSPDI